MCCLNNKVEVDGCMGIGWGGRLEELKKCGTAVCVPNLCSAWAGNQLPAISTCFRLSVCLGLTHAQHRLKVVMIY